MFSGSGRWTGRIARELGNGQDFPVLFFQDLTCSFAFLI